MQQEIWVKGEPLPIHSVVFIIYNSRTNQFLLEERPLSNPTLGGEVVFPGEKGVGTDTISTAERGVKEEMGNQVKIKKYSLLHQFMGQVGNWGEGTLQPILVTEWSGNIENIESRKGLHIWTDRDSVMSSLTFDESKHLFLIALAKLQLLKASDFESAPILKTC